MEILAKAENGGLKMGDVNREKFRAWLLKNEGARIEIKGVTPESNRMRRFFEGAVVSLVAFYQETVDYRDADDLRKVREWLKQEFNGEMVMVAGKKKVIGKSTKGELREFVEKVIEWVIENYQPPKEALDPEKYKHWRDAVFPYGGPDNYIDYLVETHVLSRGIDRFMPPLTPVKK